MLRRPRARWSSVPCIAALVVLTGCAGLPGDDEKPGTRAGLHAADVMPPGTVVFLDVTVDPADPNWQQLETLGRNIPEWASIAARIEQVVVVATRDGGTDLRALLAGEFAVGVVSMGNGKKARPQYLFSLSAKDDAEVLEALGKRSDLTAAGSQGGYSLFDPVRAGDVYVAAGRGAIVVAETRPILDAALAAAAGDSLADSHAFRAVRADLPDAAPVIGFAKTRALQQLLGVLPKESPALAAIVRPSNLVRARELIGGSATTGLAVYARPGGVRVDLVGTTRNNPAARGRRPANFAAMAPANSVFFQSAPDLGPSIRSFAQGFASAPGIAGFIDSLRVESGLTFGPNLLSILRGPGAAYMTDDRPMGLGMFVQPRDPRQAGSVLDRLVSAVGCVCSWELTSVKNGKMAMSASGLSVSYVRSGRTVFAALNARSAGGLDNAPAFRTTLGNAGTPRRRTELLWVDMPRLIGFRSADTLPANDRSWLPHVGTVVLWTEDEKRRERMSLYVGVR